MAKRSLNFLFVLILPFYFKCQIPSDAKHVYCGVGTTIGVGLLTYKITKGKWISSLAIGCASGMIAGVTKEYVWDKHLNKGTFSKTDMLYTTWGSMIGTICLVVSFDNKEKRKRKKENYEK